MEVKLLPKLGVHRTIAAAVIVIATVLGTAPLTSHGQGGGGGMGARGGMGGEDHGGMAGMGGMGGMAGMGGMGGGMRAQHAPGSVEQKCHEPGDMPPHYCEPSYKVMSSAKGIRVSVVSPAADNAIMVTLQELNRMSPGVDHPVVVAAGTGDLAGAVVVQGGWKGTTSVEVPLVGNDSIYSHESMHVHVFPMTGR